MREWREKERARERSPLRERVHRAREERKKEEKRERERGWPVMAWPAVAGGGWSWPEMGGQSPKSERS